MRHIAEQLSLVLKPGKPRYSFSQLETAKCGAKYYHNKLSGLREETYNMAAGTILDTAFNAYYEHNAHLQETHEQRIDYAKAAVELLLQEHPSWFTMEWSQKAGDVRSSPENYVAWLFEKGAKGAAAAIDLVCRKDRGPVEVQKKVELELPDYSIIGYIDCLELDTMTVVDVKSVTGWNETTQTLSYALRSQVPLYRMILSDTTKQAAKGRYELLLCRKTPKLVSVPDPDIDFIQKKLISDFDLHHQKLQKNDFEKNPEQCFQYNKLCPHFLKCWPQLTELVQPKTS